MIVKVTDLSAGVLSRKFEATDLVFLTVLILVFLQFESVEVNSVLHSKPSKGSRMLSQTR